MYKQIVPPEVVRQYSSTPPLNPTTVLLQRDLQVAILKIDIVPCRAKKIIITRTTTEKVRNLLTKNKDFLLRSNFCRILLTFISNGKKSNIVEITGKRLNQQSLTLSCSEISDCLQICSKWRKFECLFVLFCFV